MEILTQSPTNQRMSQRIIIALAPSFATLCLYIRDISQAYVQSLTKLNREFYATPPKEMNLGDWILKVIKPLYSIPEAGNY